jgi:HK97 family phage major capsid protein
MADETQTEQAEPLVWMGGEVKALGNGRVGGYLVWFGSAEQADTTGEYFDAKTDFGPLGQTSIFYQHGFDPTIGRKSLGVGTLTADEVGIWIDGQIALHDRYTRAVYKLVEAGKLGWSSGTVPHLIERVPMGKAVYLSRWLLGTDASLTPTPAEPRNTALPLKAWLEGTNLEALAEAGGESAPDAGEAPETATKSTPTEKATTMEVEVHQMDENEVRAVATAAVKAFMEMQAAERDITPVIGRVTSGGDEADRAAKGNPFKSFGEYLIAVKNAAYGSVDQRLLPLKAILGANEGIGSEGGFLVGTEQVAGLEKKVFDSGVFANRVQRRTLMAGTNSADFYGVDEDSRATSSRFGGIRGYRVAEAGTITASQPKFYKYTLKPAKYAVFAYATDEVLQDTALIEQEIMQSAPLELAFMLDDDIYNGLGAGYALGVLNSACLVSIDKETGQAAKTVVPQNLNKMFARRWVRGSYAWYINQDVWPQLWQMTQVVGVGGLPVYLPPTGLSGSPYSTLYGLPVIETEFNATLGTVGDIMLGDFSQYKVADKGGVQSASSIHVQFVTDQTCYRLTARYDGHTTWKNALTPYKGSNTVSPFIALATRA